MPFISETDAIIVVTIAMAAIIFTCYRILLWLDKTPNHIKHKMPRLEFKITTAFFTIKSIHMAVEAKIGQFSDVSVNPLDRKDNPAPVDTVKWTSSNEGVVVVETDPSDNKKAKFRYVGIGTAQVDVAVDADLDQGETEVRLLTDFIAVEVKPEEAVALGFTVSTPADEPAAGDTGAGGDTQA